MIPAPNAYFLAEEAKRRGNFARLLFSFFPHDFQTGVAAGSGTFSGCAFVAPERIQVTGGVSSPSWTSPDLCSTLENYPAQVTVSWEMATVGYNLGAEYRTAATQAGLVGAAWQPLVSGQANSFYQWYQLRFTWVGVRSLFEETENPADPLQFYWVENSGDSQESYFSEGSAGGGVASYVEYVRVQGEYPINPANIDPENITPPQWSAPKDFSDLAAGDLTFRLFDPDHKFDSNHANFLWAGIDPCREKRVRVSFGYQRPGTAIVDSFDIFIGRILRWGDRETSGEGQIPSVEIYAQDDISLLFKAPITSTDAEGNKVPVVHGNDLFIEAQQVTNFNPAAPVKAADFDTGDLSQLSGTETGAGGAIAVSTSDPYQGAYCCRTAVTAAANDKAIGKLEMALPGNLMQARVRMKIGVIPAVPEAQSARIFGAYKKDGSALFEVYADNLTRLWVKYGSNWWSTDTFLSAYTGQWVTPGFGWLAGNPGLLVIWIDSEEIFRKDDQNWAASEIFGFWFGVKTGVAAETWHLDWDQAQLWGSFYPALYQVLGGPYQEIKGVYSDCVLTTANILKPTRRQKNLNRKLKQVLKKANKKATTNYTALPEYGAIAWTDWLNLPSGQIMLNLKKDDLSHPVDIFAAMLAAWDWTAYDPANLAAVKAAVPEDAIGVYFDDGDRAEAVKEICAACLLGFYCEQGQVKLWPYTGAALGEPVMDLAPVSRSSTKVRQDRTELIPIVRGIWGWSDRNPGLKSEVTDEQLLHDVGETSDEIDVSYGQPVSSGNSLMVRAKVAALAKRLQKPLEIAEVECFLEALRLQLYDVVTLDGRKYQLLEPSLDWAAKTMTLTLYRFLGLEE